MRQKCCRNLNHQYISHERPNSKIDNTGSMWHVRWATKLQFLQYKSSNKVSRYKNSASSKIKYRETFRAISSRAECCHICQHLFKNDLFLSQLFGVLEARSSKLEALSLRPEAWNLKSEVARSRFTDTLG